MAEAMKRYPSHHCVQTGSGSYPATYPIGTGGKAAGAWSWPFTSI